MTNSTADYWDVDGTSLQQFCWNIESWANGEMPPPLRGENLVVPYRAGAIWQPKVPDERTISFAMWVIGADTNGVPGSQFRSNLKALRKLLWNPHRELTLTKRWNGGANSAVGKAQFAGGLEFEATGPSRAQFVVDLRLADPYLYGGSVSFGAKTVGTHSISVLGDVASPRHTVLLTGPLTNPTVQVKAGSTVLSSLSYSGTIGSGSSLTVAFPGFLASGVSPVGVVASQPWWVVLDPSATALVIGGTGAGSVTLSYEPAWL